MFGEQVRDALVDIKGQILEEDAGKRDFIWRISILLPHLSLQRGLKSLFPKPQARLRETRGGEPEALGEKFDYVVSPEGSFGDE